MPAQPARRPRYLQLAADLRAAILAGELAPADGFPTEAELCARYGVSRFTVREALRTLQADGLIERRRGSGTVVQPAHARGGALHQPLSNVRELLQYARDTRFHFAAREPGPLPRRIAAEVGVDPKQAWCRFAGVRRSAADEPIAVTDAFVHRDLADAAARVVPGGPAIFSQLRELAGVRVARVTQDIQAVPAPPEVAEALGVKRRAATLRIIRCYHQRDDRLFEVSVSHHPGERFAYSMHIEVDG